MREGDVEWVRSLLLERGPDVNVEKDGSALLHLAAEHGHTEIALLLLEEGADVNAKNEEDGWTSLHLALYHSHTEIAELLLERAERM